MEAINLNENKQSNRFDLPDKYLPNIWDVTSWDVYKNAKNNHKKVWRNRAGKYNNYSADFSIINCEEIREELKYCLYLDFESGINLATIGEKYGRLKNCIKFYNDRNYRSITETDISDFENYVESELGLKKIIYDGKIASVTKGKMIDSYRPNKIITSLKTMIKIISQFNEKDLEIDKYQKDVWCSADFLILEEALDFNRKIDFSSIKNNEFKNHLKAFCKHQLNVITFSSVYAYTTTICCFFKWLDHFHSEVAHLNQLNRTIIEEYFIWLRTESNFSRQKINISILNLKVFFEIGVLLELEKFPKFSLILPNDYAFKNKKEAHPFVDSEIKTIIEFIPKLNPKVYGRIIYCILNLGCRISEILHLKIEQLKQYDDNSYYLVLYQHKTKAEYEKSISDTTAKIILTEINHNKKLFGECVEYVFLNEKGNLIRQCDLNRVLAKYIIENDIRDRDGNILHCNMHRFRSTLATNLMNSGYDVESTGKLLGQKSLSSLAYYAVVSDEQAIEQLTPRIEKDELLISNIGKFDEKSLSDYDNPIQLCNGWCIRSSTMGQCAKANHCLECNMFIPTLAHLSMYEMQLRQVESSIEVAKANDMNLLVEKNQKTKVALEKIIARIKERRNTNE